MQGDVPIGVITVTRDEPGNFADHHVQLLQTFADQAVIAIENVRLFNETKEALERQTATADILKVIASSPIDVQPVFEAIATSANRLIGGFSTTVFRFIDGIASSGCVHADNPAADEVLKATFPRRSPIVSTLSSWHSDGETVQSGDRQRMMQPRLAIEESGAGARFSQHAVHAADERGDADRPHQRHAQGTGHFRRASCAVAANLRRPGRDRHRKCPAVRRGAGQDPRSHGGADLPDRKQQYPRA